MTVHVTVALDEAQKATLDAIAEGRRETVQTVVAAAIQGLIDYDAAFRAGVARGLEDVRAGRTVSNESVAARADARSA